MNYGRSSATKKHKEQSSAKIEKKIGLVFVKILLLCVLGVLIMGGCAGYGIIKGLIKNAPDISNLSVAPSETATYIYDSLGNPALKLTAPSSNRTLVTIDRIPASLQHAVVAVEDERYYTHNGIDIQGIIRAFFVGIKNGDFSEGASTITQQLLKNSVFPDWVNETSLSEKFTRKFQEQYLALQLEKKLTKEQILADYLNTINLGAGTYGVQAASQRYFNKDVSELTLSESTVIAGITQNPTQYNPILYPEQNAMRREKVLNHMLAQEYITQAEYGEALNDDVYSRIQETDSQTEEFSIYSFYNDALIEQVIEDLKEQKGYTDLQAYKAVYSGGLKIYSAQDEQIQQICDEEFANPGNYPAGTEVGVDYALSIQDGDGQTTHYSSEMFMEYYRQFEPGFNLMFGDEATARTALEQYKNSLLNESDTVLSERISLLPQPQASVVILDQETGYVKAIVGGRGNKEASLTLNRATSSRRQPGSTFKILTTYAPALEEGMTLSTVFDNAPYAYSTGVEVNNWDSNNTYTGLTTIRNAITNSINIVAVKCLTEITPREGLKYAEKFGITTLYADEALDMRQPLALGGITDGVVNIELAGAYASIANKGQYNKPKFYSRIEDQDGNIIIDNSPVSSTVIKESTAFLLTSAMQDVVTAGTGSAIDLGEMPVAGKTGTTSDYRDIWFTGYTPYYTCSIWGGYDNHDELPDSEMYHTYHKTLWNSIMQRVHQNLSVKQFPSQSHDIVEETVCMKSGKLAIQGICTGDRRGSQSYTEYFVKGTEPEEKCDVHIAVSVCSETGLLVSSTCKAVTKICIQRPKDSEGTTEDSSYGVPYKTCGGHTVVDKIKDKFKKPDKKVPEVTVPDDSDSDDEDSPSGPGATKPRAEEDG